MTIDAARYGAERLTVDSMLEARVRDCPHRTMMIIGDESISFLQMWERSAAAANILLREGIAPGETLALFGGSTPEWVYLWLGAARMGARVAAINAASKGEYLRHALTIARAKAVFTDTEERRRRVLEIADHVETLRIYLDNGVDLADDDGSTASTVDAPQHDIPALFYTSGTTGRSKAVVTSWQYLFSAAATVADAWEYSVGEVIWSPMPLFHLSAVATVLAPMLVGGTAVLAKSFHPGQVWDAVRECNAVGFVGAGAMVSMLWNLPPDDRDAETGLRFISAAPISADVYRDIERRYKCRVVTMYGLTEAFPLAAKSVAEDGVPGTSGRVNDNVDVAILDAHDTPLIGEVGEIACRPRVPNVMSEGYTNADGAVDLHAEWFRTGDLGTIDEDGQLTYVDRAKDAIRRRGENVSSVEVEAVVTQHPLISEAAAVAVPSDLGEDDILVVVTATGVLDPIDLMDFCAERLPYFCVPRYVLVADELPKNAMGRVQKHLLRTAGPTADAWDRERHGYVVRR
jgi:crotonobetaine/carnitine-CoA ligase